jgi:hypothetical protein
MWSAAGEDCRCALHCVLANAKQYNFDPSRVVLHGDRPEGFGSLSGFEAKNALAVMSKLDGFSLV